MDAQQEKFFSSVISSALKERNLDNLRMAAAPQNNFRNIITDTKLLKPEPIKIQKQTIADMVIENATKNPPKTGESTFFGSGQT